MGDGHEALRCSRYSMDSVPPDGHGLVLVSQRLSGAGATQLAAQSPLSTNTPGVPSHTQPVVVGEPLGLGHVHVRRSPVVQLLPVPVMPAGQAPLYGAGRHSGAGAEQAAAQPLMVLRVAPVLLHDDQPPNVAGGRLVVPAGQL